MTFSNLLPSFLIAALFTTAGADAAGIDMDDPRRSIGREGNVRVDAQLVRDTVSPGAPIAVRYQIQNFSDSEVAIAEKTAEASFDEETRTVTLTIGAEVPPGGNLPAMTVIGPGKKAAFTVAATPALRASTLRSALAAVPRYVQVKVAILRDLGPFATLLGNHDPRRKQPLSDEQFDRWFESSDTIFLNSVPVQFAPVQRMSAEY